MEMNIPPTIFSNTKDPEVELEKSRLTAKIFPIENDYLLQLQTSAHIKEFSEALTNEERMKVSAKYYSILGKNNYIEQCFREVETKTNFKDKMKSEQFRNQGNSMYHNGDIRKALELYTKSIAYAPQDSSELHLAYANRSAVLRSMGKCRECLVDVERALTHGYPRDKSFKLLLREMQCHRDLGNMEQMNVSCQKTEILLESMPGLTEKEVAALKQQLDDEKKTSPKEVCIEQVIFPTEVPELSYGESSEIVGASSAVRIAYTEQQGRHLVADRDINIGDVLLIGENIVSTLNDNRKYDHCSHCHKPCYNLLPCHNCVWVLFCSEQCQSEANKKYHIAECPAFSRFCAINGTLLADDINDRVIRLIAMIGINNLQPYLKYAKFNPKKPCAMSNEAKRTRGFNANGVFDSTNIDTIFNSITMIDKQDQSCVLGLSLFSLQIPRCFGMSMKDRNFFAVAGLCLQLQDTSVLASLSSSYYSFRSVPMTKTISTDAFNPLNSLVNHSCWGNLGSIHYGNKTVSSAIWPISKGSILTESYAHLTIMFPKIQRQQLLKKTYLFDCNCIACENDWRLTRNYLSDPVDQKMANDLLKFEENFIVACHKFLPQNQLDSIFKKFVKNRHNFLTKLWEKGNYQDINCYTAQAVYGQLRIYHWLQANRVVIPCKESQKPSESLAKSIELILENNLI